MNTPCPQSATLPVLNPSTLEVVGEVPNSSAPEVDTAIGIARQASPAWAASPERAAILLACAKDLKGNAMRLARLLSQEQGKPLREAIEELMGAAHWLRSVAELDLPAPEMISTPQGEAQLNRRPAGVVAAITPWNYPVILALWKLAPALFTGNCVLLKPSPYTPLSSIEIGNLLSTHLPDGVLQILTGDDDTGRHLVEHAGIDHISLTGSVAAGRAVGSQAGHDLKSATLELGGNDAAIILEDADPAVVAGKILKNAFKNCGQTCMAIKRVYVHRSLHDELAEAMHSLANEFSVGDGLASGVQMGPLNNEPQLQIVQELLTDARERGGSVICGGDQLNLPGYFHQPTIVAGLPDDALLVTEEQFGPVLPLLAFDEVDEAIARVNSSRFGLGGSVWSPNHERAREVAERLECGTTWINQHSTTDPSVPFGGTKDSGLGYANGRAGLEEFTRLRVDYLGI